MIARSLSLIVLLAACWVVFQPRRLPEFDMESVSRVLRQRFAMHEERFEANGLLPQNYLLLLPDTDGPLLSIYVGFYPTQGLAALGPHDPHVCYASQSWNLGATSNRELQVDGKPATVQALTLQKSGAAMFVTWWSQEPGALPIAPEDESLLDDLLRSWGSGRSDLLWVRLEWRPEMAAPDRFQELQSGIAETIRALAPGFR